MFHSISVVKRTLRNASNKPDSEPISPPELLKSKKSEIGTPKRKHSDAESPKPVDDESENVPISKKRSRRNNPSTDKSESELNRVPSLDQVPSPRRISENDEEMVKEEEEKTGEDLLASLAVEKMRQPNSSKFVFHCS